MSTHCNCEKSKCATNQCGCKKNDKLCDDECGCSNCQNRSDSNPNNDENDENDEQEAYSDINDLASIITKKVRIPVSNKREKVFEFRNNKDLYTNKDKSEVEDPEVDHIVEDQIVGRAAANVLAKATNQSYQPYLESLKNALNLKSLENYNVTFGDINVSKGAVIKTYLKDNYYKGYPLRSVVKPETHFGANMELIFQVMNNTHCIVEEHVAQGRRSDGHVTGGPTFQEISDELARIFDEMDLELETKRRRFRFLCC